MEAMESEEIDDFYHELLTRFSLSIWQYDEELFLNVDNTRRFRCKHKQLVYANPEDKSISKCSLLRYIRPAL